MQIVEDKHVIDVKRMWIRPAMCWEEIPLCQYSFMILCYMQGTEVTAQACQWYENWLNAFVRTPVAYEKSEVCTWVTRFKCCEDFDTKYAVRNMYLQNCWILLLNRCCYTKSFNPPMRARETSAYALCVCVYVCGACTCKIQKKCRLQPNIPFPQAMTKLRALHEWSRGGASTPVCKGSPRQRGCIDTPGHTIVGLTSPWARRNILLV